MQEKKTKIVLVRLSEPGIKPAPGLNKREIPDYILDYIIDAGPTKCTNRLLLIMAIDI